MSGAEELTDLDLLATALRDAMDARARGVVIGPVDEVALVRAARRARRQDGRRLLRSVPGGAA